MGRHAIDVAGNVSPLRGCSVNIVLYPRLTPWATDLAPLRGWLREMSLSSPQLATAESRRSHLIRICKTFPEVSVEPVNEHLKISIRKKTIAYYQFDHHGDGMISLVCKSHPHDQRRMIRTDTETFFVPDYLGAKGWLGIRLDLAEVDWDTVTDTLRRAYQDLAPKRLAALLD